MTYETVDESLDAASDGPVSASVLMTTLMQITIAMSAGAFIYEELVKIGIQLPTYLCALFVGIFIRNLSDVSGLYKVHLRLADTIRRRRPFALPRALTDVAQALAAGRALPGRCR